MSDWNLFNIMSKQENNRVYGKQKRIKNNCLIFHYKVNIVINGKLVFPKRVY